MRQSRDQDPLNARANLPERRLMAAILGAAFHALERLLGGGGAPDADSLEETLRWFRCRGTEYVFSFQSICGHLEIDPAAIRERVDEVVRGRLEAGAFHPVSPPAP